VIAPFAQDVILHQRAVSGTDSYGDDTWTDTQTSVKGVFYSGQSAEASDQTVAQPVVYLLDPTVDVTWLDAIEVGGVTYEVDGSPDVWAPHPLTGWSAGIEVHLKTALRPT